MKLLKKVCVVSFMILICSICISTSNAYAAMSDDDFFQLCATGTIQDVRVAIKNGTDVKAKNEYGETALWPAAFNSNPAILTVLLEHGIDVNARDVYGTTVLMITARNNTNPANIPVLVKNGADINARQHESEQTALMWAAYSNSNPEVISVLLKNGADINAKEKEGMTALSYAAWKNPNPEVVSILLKNGADVSIKNNSGARAIDHASENANLKNTSAYQELLAASNAGQEKTTTASAADVYDPLYGTDSSEVDPEEARKGLEALMGVVNFMTNDVKKMRPDYSPNIRYTWLCNNCNQVKVVDELSAAPDANGCVIGKGNYHSWVHMRTEKIK